MDLSQCRVLVTPTSFGSHDPRLKRDLELQVGEVIYNPTGQRLPSAAVASLLKGIDGYIAGLDVIDQTALQAADRLRIIARYGAGVDNIDLKEARRRGIIVTNTPAANAGSVAELAVALMLSLARKIPEAVSSVRQAEWPRMSGTSLEGKTIGIIGLGAVGKELARRLKGFGCRVVAFDPDADLEFAQQYGIEATSMDDVLQRADFVSLNLPLTAETRGMVDRVFLARMKAGAYLVNTARGGVVDEAALVDALRNGHLSGAALDTFSIEPPRADNPLLALPQVIATPHLGAHTDVATNNMGWMTVRDCLAVLRGQEPTYRVV